MTQEETRIWLSTIRETVSGYGRMVDATVEQLSDEELFSRPGPDINSVAVILRHLGGNLCSRWTDFLTSDGEKPDRDRDAEFTDWDGDRQSLLDHFHVGWAALESAIAMMDDNTVSQTIYIRGEPHSVAQALLRSVTHVTYHVGQIAIVARMVHQGDWKWLTVAPGDSVTHNQKTWGTAASRSIFSGIRKSQ